MEKNYFAVMDFRLGLVSLVTAGLAFRQQRPRNPDVPVLSDFFIRAEAAALNLPLLTNDRRRLAAWPDVGSFFLKNEKKEFVTRPELRPRAVGLYPIANSSPPVQYCWKWIFNQDAPA